MKKGFYVVAIGLVLTLSGGFAYSQEREPEKAPRAVPGMPPMPMPGAPNGRNDGARRDRNDVGTVER